MIERYLPLPAALAFAACTSSTWESATPHFSVRPYGTVEQLTKRESQKGSDIGPLLLQKDLVELTIAQGGGLDGFDDLRVYGDGTGYAFFGKPEGGASNQKRRFQLSQSELAGLVSAINRDRIARIAGLYTTRAADGNQGFVEVKTTVGRVYSWLDNYFEPVTNTFGYCNDVLWPLALSRRSVRDRKRFERQEEYVRVFGL